MGSKYGPSALSWNIQRLRLHINQGPMVWIIGRVGRMCRDSMWALWPVVEVGLTMALAVFGFCGSLLAALFWVHGFLKNSAWEELETCQQ